MADIFQTHIRLGILGGGQLARMLLEAAYALGISPLVLAPNEDDPAAAISNRVRLGKTDDEKILRQFFSVVDIVIFENEFIPTEILKRAALGARVRFVPT